MSGFNFEKDLDHQTNAVNAVLETFSGVSVSDNKDKTIASVSNPIVELGGNLLYTNLNKIQQKNNIDTSKRNKNSNVFDISMETGTGKTYTYTKMMFKLHNNLGVGKFIVIVPTLSIKAGTVNFLKAKATKEHFRQDYNCDIKTYIVESQSGSKKSKKSYMPQAVREFVEARTDTKKIHVLIINAGMINSDTMATNFDINLFDKFSSPFTAISSTKPFTIIDEPHKFGTDKKTWKNIQKFNSQYIFRYGATFDDKYENLIYTLTAIDAFNQDLVKGVVTHIEDFNQKENAWVTLTNTDGKEATFELNVNGKKSSYKLIKGASLSKIHNAMHDLNIENLNKTKVVLSNGLELKKGDKINPYSYHQSLQSRMIENAIKRHFELEKEYLTQDVKIKPLTLFFIDDIAGYRDGDNISGSLKQEFEELATQYIIKTTLENETNEFYRNYLQKSLDDISQIHGGYFSKDNTDKDDKIEKEVNEILHDKEKLLSLDNTRRFIFSKWTLREGWDNPNVFQICKLRSSGSVTSKLQEVGRGLRIPVNEFMAREKGKNYELHYYVDFTEKDFTEQLVGEINQKSQALFVDNPTKLTDEMIAEIVKLYDISEDDLLEHLDNENVIKRSNDFKDGGYARLKELYPRILSETLKTGKVKNANDKKPKATIRQGKYEELKDLWEKINQKVILEYKIESEEQFKQILLKYFQENSYLFKTQEIISKNKKLVFENDLASIQEFTSLNMQSLQISTMSYRDFIRQLAIAINVNIKTLHYVFAELKDSIDITKFMNNQTIRLIKSGFSKYMLDNAIDKYEIGYNKVSNTIHPTKFTDDKGSCLSEISAMDLGVVSSNDKTADEYLFNEMFYDSELEKQNIMTNIDEVIVFTKIPKNSIKIPVAGGDTYSPDFAYIFKDKYGEKSLSLIVETKNKAKRTLFKDEEQKIRHAQQLFSNSEINVEFKTQFDGDKISDILRSYLGN
ncbi:restriction endonuclease EcoPI subunit R [Candidatus Francisella endociliophora]|uniref:Restriction endonuclease EcoPI subunit R n=1 Tax=Candidatus Francisella endociliophora TaxID=653937 RepID=A0A097ER77_9GAMM|nr:type III restriction-modification system endonuclease [Francisella sp. FSC1006]AIT10059.1 restriction endonuclease EcoPI subunit R [Francisella sp. FSC1006]